MTAIDLPVLVVEEPIRRSSPPALASGPDTEVWVGPDGRRFGASRRTPTGWLLEVDSAGTFAVTRDLSVVRASPHGGADTAAVEDAWVRQVLPLVVQARGVEILHASGVLFGEGLVAITGPGGAGKSTLAWALQDQGHDTWCDDALPFDRAGNGFVSFALPFRVRLRAGALDARGGGSKTAVEARTPSRAVVPLRLIVVLESPNDRRPVGTLDRLPAAEAFPLLLEQAWSLEPAAPDRRRRLVGGYLDLSKSVPAYRFTRGDDLSTLRAQAALFANRCAEALARI